MGTKYDFSGWATRNDLECADGRTIRKDAFKENDGQTVPLVWQHLHDDPMKVLGHALLENREEGVYMYGTFNETPQGQNARQLVQHGDVTAVSIYANHLKQSKGNVLHGDIKEVSLVLAGANPGALIDVPIIAHSGEECEDEAIIYTGEPLELQHADDGDEESSKEEEKKMADEPKTQEPEEKEEEKTSDDKTVKDVLDTLNDEQKKAVYFMIGQALEDAGAAKHSDEEGDDATMKHNVFDKDTQEQAVLSHDDMKAILKDAQSRGSLREAVEARLGDDEVLMHAIDTTGMTTATGTQTYGFNDPSMLFPDYHNLNNPPEWISRRMEWVSKVMNGVHHTPFSRIKSQYANITEDAARARGYIKGKQKKTEVFTTLKRTTDPQTIYKLQKMDRDDILDITDFDVVAWIKAEMRVMLEEEIARAILIGDGRESDAEDKISEAHIRPIATDVALFNVKVPVSVAKGADGADKAKALIDAVIRARKNYKGSGNPTWYTTEDMVTECLLLEDEIGRKLYKSVAELATALRVRDIVTVEPMEDQTIKVNDKEYPLAGVIVNLVDYNVGADKGGAVAMFDDFDIDYNRYSYLIETRISGALTKPFSALTIYIDEAAA